MFIRALITLVLGAGIAGLAWFYADASMENARLEKQSSTLLDRQRALIRQERELEKQIGTIRRWVELETRAREMGLNPAGWMELDLNLSRNLDWEELSSLLSFLSDAGRVRSGYLFLPQRLRVELGGGTESETEPPEPGMEDDGAAPLAEETGSPAQDDETTEMQTAPGADSYGVMARGRFLMAR